MPAILVFDVGKMINEYNKIKDATKYSSDDKINCLKKLIEIQEKYKLTNDEFFTKEYQKEYELCEKIIKY
jgi:hypothetical protein